MCGSSSIGWKRFYVFGEFNQWEVSSQMKTVLSMLLKKHM